MSLSLRKGLSSVYIQHQHTGHNIGAEKFACEIENDKAVLRFDLRPVDGNQAHDETQLHGDPLESVTIDDDGVITRLRKYIESTRLTFSSWELQITSRGKMLSFAVKPQVHRHGAHEVLYFHVVKMDG